MTDRTTTLVRGVTAVTGVRAVAQLFTIIGADGATPSRHLLDGLDEVRIGRGEQAARRDSANRCLTLTLPDRHMSREHARLRRIHERWVIEDLGAKNGMRIDDAPLKRAAVLDGDIVELGATLLAVRITPPAHAALADLIAPDVPTALPGIITFHGGLAGALEDVARLARTHCPSWSRATAGPARKSSLARCTPRPAVAARSCP